MDGVKESKEKVTETVEEFLKRGGTVKKLPYLIRKDSKGKNTWRESTSNLKGGGFSQ